MLHVLIHSYNMASDLHLQLHSHELYFSYLIFKSGHACWACCLMRPTLDPFQDLSTHSG